MSAGQNNEELVDNLCHEGYIHEPRVEKVVERALITLSPYLSGPGDEATPMQLCYAIYTCASEYRHCSSTVSVASLSYIVVIKLIWLHSE